MLSLVYHGPNDLRLDERDIPSIGRSEALLKVVAAGICGTDLRIAHGAHSKYPPGTMRTPGHEFVGDIVDVGPDVKGISVGQRVFVAPNIGCGRCRQCMSGYNNRCPDYEAFGITMDGAFAEYVCIPADAIQQGNVIALDPGIDPAGGALIEPFACVLRGQDAVSIQPGDIILVVGAGPIGTMHVMLARLRGAGRVIVSDLLPDRLAFVAQVGADRVVNPVEEDLAAVIAAESGGQGADVVIVAAPSHQAQEEALRLAAVGGRINFFGGLPKDQSTIQCDANLVHYKELMVTGTTACSTNDCRRAATLVNTRRVDLTALISARFPLCQAVDAFAAAQSRASLKVIIEP